MTSGMTSGAVDEHGEERAAAEAAIARQRIARQRAEHQRAGRRHERDLEADQRRILDRRVVQELAVPAGREAGPDRDQARGVEGIDDRPRRSARRGTDSPARA